MQTIAFLSGKGGTGKTSILASIAVLAEDVALVDCDVDASNLPLLFPPTPVVQQPFISGVQPIFDPDLCTGCGACVASCRFDALEFGRPPSLKVHGCEGCGACAIACPHNAIELGPHMGGVWYRSTTRLGTMHHARLAPGGENSGMLVNLLKHEARRLQKESGTRWLFLDGPPGVGCPVISTLTGCDYVATVTEPSPSAWHDLQRTLELVQHFSIPAGVCMNRWSGPSVFDDRLEQLCQERGIDNLGKVRTDPAFREAQSRQQALTEFSPDSPAFADLVGIWERIQANLKQKSAKLVLKAL